MRPLDVDRARRETPGCSNVVHLNNAGAALPPGVVTEAVVAHLRREAQIGGYEAADDARPALDAVYDSIARLIGAAPAEIALVENATRAWDMAFYAFRFEPGDHILTARAEYVSNVLAFLQVARRTGATIDVVDDDEHGQIDVGQLRRRLAALGSAAKLVAVTHVPSSGGLVNPVVDVGKATREARVPFLLDACQSVGQLPVDVRKIGCDLLAATGRKFLRGPRGTGFLYVRADLAPRLEPPFIDLHSATWTGPGSYEIRPDARRFETWEANYAGRLGLGAAVDYALSWGLDAIGARVTELADGLRERLAEVPGVAVHDRGQRRCGIVTFSVAGVGSAQVQQRLRALAINTSVTLAGNARLDLAERGLGDLVRASVHYYNTESELDRLCGEVRRMST